MITSYAYLCSLVTVAEIGVHFSNAAIPCNRMINQDDTIYYVRSRLECSGKNDTLELTGCFVPWRHPTKEQLYNRISYIALPNIAEVYPQIKDKLKEVTRLSDYSRICSTFTELVNESKTEYRRQDWVHYESVCEVPVKDDRKIFVAINYGWHRCRSGWPIVEKCVVSHKEYKSYTYAPETYMCANKTLSKEWFSSGDNYNCSTIDSMYEVRTYLRSRMLKKEVHAPWLEPCSHYTLETEQLPSTGHFRKIMGSVDTTKNNNIWN